MELIETESLAGAVTSQLRDAILGGDLRPGEPIQVKDLQDRLGVSHIPIREAIRQLEAEGLVVAPPRRRPVVAGVGLEDLDAIYELRRLIELPTVRAARDRAGEREIRRIRESFKSFEEIASDATSPDYWRQHAHFHWVLIEPGANSWTRRMLDPLWAGSERYVRLFASQYTSSEYTVDLHRKLVDAYASDDPDAIVGALDDHFAETERVIRAALGAPTATSRNRSPQ